MSVLARSASIRESSREFKFSTQPALAAFVAHHELGTPRGITSPAPHGELARNADIDRNTRLLSKNHRAVRGALLSFVSPNNLRCGIGDSLSV